MAEKIGVADDFNMFKDEEILTDNATTSTNSEPETESFSTEDKGQELEVTVEPKAEGSEDDAQSKTEVKPEPEKKPEVPADYQQAIQFKQQFEQFLPLVQGVMSLPEEEKRNLFYKMQGGYAPQPQQQQQAQPQVNQILPLTEEQIKDIDDFVPGVGKAISMMAQEIANLRAEQQNVGSKFKTQEQIAHQERVVQYKEKYSQQIGQLKKTYPEIEDNDIETIKMLGQSVLQNEINRGNMNAEINLFDMGSAYMKRLDNLLSKRTKKPPDGGSNTSGVQKKPPAKLSIDIDKGVENASSIGDVLDSMFAAGGL